MQGTPRVQLQSCYPHCRFSEQEKKRGREYSCSEEEGSLDQNARKLGRHCRNLGTMRDRRRHCCISRCCRQVGTLHPPRVLQTANPTPLLTSASALCLREHGIRQFRCRCERAEAMCALFPGLGNLGTAGPPPDSSSSSPGTRDEAHEYNPRSYTLRSCSLGRLRSLGAPHLPIVRRTRHRGPEAVPLHVRHEWPPSMPRDPKWWQRELCPGGCCPPTCSRWRRRRRRQHPHLLLRPRLLALQTTRVAFLALARHLSLSGSRPKMARRQLARSLPVETSQGVSIWASATA